MCTTSLPPGKQIILFDGVCNLCDSLVQYVIRHDKEDFFRFVSLQSKTGQDILATAGIANEIDSIILYQPGVAYYVKSEAALRIAMQLGGFNKLVIVMKVFPTRIRDLIYSQVAKNRYKWFGRKDSCVVNGAGSEKFID